LGQAEEDVQMKLSISPMNDHKLFVNKIET